jgi:hypothetical protein
MFNILNNKGNAKQNDIGLLSHPSQKYSQPTNAGKYSGEMEHTYTLLVGM